MIDIKRYNIYGHLRDFGVPSSILDTVFENDEDAQVLKEKAFRKITRLEENNESLKEEYIESNKDERVFGAVVTNYKLLTRALDKVIEGLNEHNYKKSNTQ